MVKPISRRIIHPLCKTLFNCLPRQIEIMLQRSSVTMDWLLIGVPLAWLSNIKPRKYLSKIEPDARCDEAPTDKECLPGIAIQFLSAANSTRWDASSPTDCGTPCGEAVEKKCERVARSPWRREPTTTRHQRATSLSRDQTRAR